MRMYWTKASIPELADLPPEQQRRLWRRCCPRAFLHWQVWVALLLGWAIGGGLLYLGQRVTDAWWGVFLAIPPASLIATLICTPTCVAFARPYLRAAREHASQTQP
jgi:hypothetical protein